jgi:integrase
MARSPRPWFRKDRGYWCCYFNGKLVKLAEGKKNRQAAMRAYDALLAGEEPDKLPKEQSDLTIAAMAEHFYRSVKPTVKARTLEGYKQYIGFFTEDHPRIRASAITPKVLTDWMAGRDWNPTSRFHFLTIIKRLFSWAEDDGLIQTNPIAKMKKPKPLTRAVIPTKDEAETLVNKATPRGFRELLLFMYETGARTSEAMHVERRHIDLENRVIIFPPDEQKSGWKTGEPRIIYLSDVAFRLVEELSKKHPKGPIFRNSRGEPWNSLAVCVAMSRNRDKLNLGDLTAYGLRHRWITDGMLKFPSGIVARMAGHKGTAMIERVYGHVGQHADLLRDAARSIRSEETKK